MTTQITQIIQTKKATRAALERYKKAEHDAALGYTKLCRCGRPANHKLGRCYVILADKRRVPIDPVCSTTCAERERHRVITAGGSSVPPKPASTEAK